MIQGSLVAIVTPMHADGSVDETAFRRLIDWHVEQGTDAIVAVGTTGESATLDEHEHCAAIALAVEQAAGRVPVIAGTGANSTSEAIALTRCALDAGLRMPPRHALWVVRQAAEGLAAPVGQQHHADAAAHQLAGQRLGGEHVAASAARGDDEKGAGAHAGSARRRASSSSKSFCGRVRVIASSIPRPMPAAMSEEPP